MFLPDVFMRARILLRRCLAFLALAALLNAAPGSSFDFVVGPSVQLAQEFHFDPVPVPEPLPLPAPLPTPLPFPTPLPAPLPTPEPSPNPEPSPAPNVVTPDQPFETNQPISDDDKIASPFVVFLLPTNDTYAKIYGAEYTAAVQEEMDKATSVANGFSAVGSQISHSLTRSELLDAIDGHPDQHLFIVVCHTEGPRESRRIPLGDDNITVDFLRSRCAGQGKELFLVTCQSEDLRSTANISTLDALGVVNDAFSNESYNAQITVGAMKSIFRGSNTANIAPNIQVVVDCADGDIILSSTAAAPPPDNSATPVPVPPAPPDNNDDYWRLFLFLVLIAGLIVYLIKRKKS